MPILPISNNDPSRRDRHASLSSDSTSSSPFLNLAKLEDKNVNIDDLPEEMILEIFRKLEADKLNQIASVNRKWKQLAENENLWQLLCKRDFSLVNKLDCPSIPLSVAYEETWRKSYQLRKMGYNKITDEEGIIREGIFKDGTLNGPGKITFPGGTVAEGEFKDGDLNGQGILIFSDGKRWEGEFKNNELDGYGKKISSDGKVEEGIFRSGQLTSRAGPPAKSSPSAPSSKPSSSVS
jgi:hypothetical protein